MHPPLELLLVGVGGTHELRKRAGALRELRRHATLDEAAVAEHEQLVAVHDGADAVRDDYHRTLPAAAADRAQPVPSLHSGTERVLDDGVRLPARSTARSACPACGVQQKPGHAFDVAGVPVEAGGCVVGRPVDELAKVGGGASTDRMIE